MSNIKLFEDSQIRALWDAEKEEWYFSVVDIVEVLTESKDPKQYIKKMRSRDAELSGKWGAICTPVEMLGKDKKKREIMAASTQGILRLIQSIPSPKAEPFKMWLAQIGSERLDEIADPEKAILRGADYYRAKGYTEGWINQRLQTIEMRKELTDEWQARGVSDDKGFAILTNELTKAWSGMTVQQYKAYKDLTKENLRDNMTNIELTLNQLAEVTTTAISKVEKPTTFEQQKKIARDGGDVAKQAKDTIEKRIGQGVISAINARTKQQLEVELPSQNMERIGSDDKNQESNS